MGCSVSISYGVFRAYTVDVGPHPAEAVQVSISYGVFRAYTLVVLPEELDSRVSISYGVFRAYTQNVR